uniref:Uncharacterized protein n=1 Tax=Anguilla anguilla TaxID=7936 RepID=A0A0E9XPJ4_ANGAN
MTFIYYIQYFSICTDNTAIPQCFLSSGFRLTLQE